MLGDGGEFSPDSVETNKPNEVDVSLIYARHPAIPVMTTDWGDVMYAR